MLKCRTIYHRKWAHLKLLWTIACAAQFAITILYAEPGPTFLPDARFQGSTLTGWHTLGSASWSAGNGEITAKGSPKQILKAKNSLTGQYLSGRKEVTRVIHPAFHGGRRRGARDLERPNVALPQGAGRLAK